LELPIASETSMDLAINPARRVQRSIAGAVLFALALALLPVDGPWARTSGPHIPAPLVDEQAGQTASGTMVLAGGCFWGVQGVFQHIKGVLSAVSGYAGGDKSNARYDRVTTGATGHAEAVRITYDPRVVSYGRLLQVFFSVVHDPTQLNRQGPDVGSQYRSAIFPADPEQARIAGAYISQLNASRVFEGAIVTKLEPQRTFYAAEDYHQDFLVQHPSHPYIVMHDLAKIRDLQQAFPELYRADPVLVTASPSAR
jgi:peptide-methionine (S)-S-oxide reductase